MLIPSLYATSPRTQSLRPVRVPSDQNTRWRLPFHFSTNKRQYFLVSLDTIQTSWILKSGIFAATSRTCDRMATPLGTLWTKLCFCLICFFCFRVFLIYLSFCYLLICFKYFYTYCSYICIELSHASYRTVTCITYFDFEKHTQALS